MLIHVSLWSNLKMTEVGAETWETNSAFGPIGRTLLCLLIFTRSGLRLAIFSIQHRLISHLVPLLQASFCGEAIAARRQRAVSLFLCIHVCSRTLARVWCSSQ